MSITFEDAINRATSNGGTDYARAWTIASRAARLYLACTNELTFSSRVWYVEWAEELPVPTTHGEFWDRVEEVRERVVEECENRNICLGGGNRFLAVMGLEEIETHHDYCVSVTVTIDFRVSGSTNSAEYVERDVREYLNVTVNGNVDDAEFGDDLDVSIDSIDVSAS